MIRIAQIIAHRREATYPQQPGTTFSLALIGGAFLLRDRMMMVRNHANTQPCNVFVNGALVKHVLMFDVERGKCVVARQPVTARLRCSGPSVLRHTMYGVVTFKPLR